MIDPFTAAAIGSTAIKGVTGLAQYLKGRKMGNQNVRPEYEIPLEIRNKLTAAQLMSYRGLPEEQKQQFLQNIQRSTQGAMLGLSSRRAGLAGIGSLAQSEMDAYGNLMSMDAQQRMQNIQNYGNVQSEMAGYQDKAFQVNKLDPYMQKAEATQALKGAGLQNLMGAIDSGVDLLGQNEYLKSLTGQDTQKTSAPYEPSKEFLKVRYQAPTEEEINQRENEDIYNQWRKKKPLGLRTLGSSNMTKY